MKIDAPRIRISARAVDILKTPDEFYRELKASISRANHRIFLATLYIGSKETELVEVLQSKLQENKTLKVHILSDGIRGTREFPKSASTASLLSPLVSQFPSQVTVSLYQTPAFKGVAKLLPKRFNEGCGLQHMKLYGVDDEIVLSGANLSSDYFTNRQDRYIRIRDKNVTQFFWNLFEGVADVSYILKPNGVTGPANFEMQWPHKYQKSDIGAQKKRLQNIPWPEEAGDAKQATDSTYIYPLVGFSPFGIGNENKVMAQLCASGLPYALTAGYFNIDESLKQPLLAAKAPGQVIVAAPEANGFFESRGLSKNVPDLYSLLASKFQKEAKAVGAPIKMVQWKRGVITRGGWSYHAKGLWLSHHQGEAPFLTVIGSSNYTKRAYKHDMEAGAVITTTDPELQQALQRELTGLLADTTTLLTSSKDTPAPTIWQRAFVKVFGDRL